ncbi:MAG: hypothetical protein HY738_21740 [Bacteroidia bacterium]|nr:hypothetical protein [Bacteroidia bacterium]
MKSHFFILVIIWFVFISNLRFYSVKQSTDEFDLTREIEKNLALYSEPDTCIKSEPVYDSTYNKEKEEINDGVLREKIISAILDSYTKTKVLSSKSTAQFGVFKDGSCYGYPELDIYLDCEDHNPLTEKFGWTGNSYVLDNKNADLQFCIVAGYDIFHRTNKDYALLLLGDFVQGYDYYERWITNEYENNINKTTLNGVQIYNTGDEYDDANNLFYTDGHPYTSGEDSYYITILFFNFFPKTTDGSMNNFPDFGLPMSYGVLGRFGTHQGYIYLDDEDGEGNDNDNINCMFKYEYNEDTGNWTIQEDYGSIPNIMDCGNNTRFYISKAMNCPNP